MMTHSRMPGNAYVSIQNPRMYRALRRRGFSKQAAARISNARTPGTTVKTPALLRVTKDAAGADRWLSVTTTAYEDREHEIITTAGLAHAVAFGDATGMRGVLRYWHVPGFDLGPCDFQTTTADGRLLLESGTFFSPTHAQLGRAMAQAGWQMSPGFYHPPNEPYAATIGGRRVKLYDRPILFERSVAPPGRTANRFTELRTTKDTTMDEAKRAALKTLLGYTDAEMQTLLAYLTQVDAAAHAQAVYKADASAPADAAASTDVNAAANAAAPAVYKAADAAAPANAEASTDAETSTDAEEPADAEEGIIITEAEARLIAQVVVAELRPILTELTAALNAAVTRKDDARLSEIAARLAVLEGDAPRAVTRELGMPAPAPVAAHATSLKDASLRGDDAWRGVESFLRGFHIKE